MLHPRLKRRLTIAAIAMLVLLLPLIALVGILASKSQPPTLAVAPAKVLSANPYTDGAILIEGGDVHRGLAQLLAIPESHRDYSRAQRYIGWKFYVGRRGEVGPALPYVHRALFAEPFSSNAWEDAMRVWGRALKGGGTP